MTETAQAIEAVQAVPVQADQVDPIAAVAEPVPTDQPTRAVVRGAPVVVAREVVVQRAPTGIGFGSCIRGIDVRLHWSLFLVTVLTMLLAWYWEEGLMRILLHFVVYGPVLYLTVLLHELGHAFTTMRLGKLIFENWNHSMNAQIVYFCILCSTFEEMLCRVDRCIEQ